MKQLKNIIILILFINVGSAISQNIFKTACQGDLSGLNNLLQNGTIDIQDDRGRSLLHWAIACNKPEIFNFLINRNINPNLEDNMFRTPMYVAVQFENEFFFDELKKLQPTHSWIENHGAALLEKAILLESRLFIEKLINSGVNVNARNERGSTPLEISKRIGALEVYQLLLTLGADKKLIRSITLSGMYMGQEPPEGDPVMFAPNFISTEESEFGSVFNSAITEFYYAVDVNGKNEIRYSQIIENQWSQPKTIFSHTNYGYNDPFLSNNEERLYFISKRALDGIGGLKDVDIWYADKVKDGWSEPVHAGTNINTTGDEYYISFSQNGTLYFSSNGHNPNKKDHDIYFSQFIDGIYQKPVALSDEINTTAYEADVFISPDESYIIFSSTRDLGFGRGDLYISFKNLDGAWTKAVNMGRKINTQHHEYCPYVTKDGKFLFYTSNQDIYWVSADVLKEVKYKNYD